MKMSYSRRLTADAIEIDDWFKIGGEMYRVIDLTTDQDTIAIAYLPAAELNSPIEQARTLIVRNKTILKIYNQ